MEGLKNFATCSLYVAKKTVKVLLSVSRPCSPLQHQLSPFDITAVVVVSRRTELHGLRSPVFREVALQPFVEALYKGVNV